MRLRPSMKGRHWRIRAVLILILQQQVILLLHCDFGFATAFAVAPTQPGLPLPPVRRISSSPATLPLSNTGRSRSRKGIISSRRDVISMSASSDNRIQAADGPTSAILLQGRYGALYQVSSLQPSATATTTRLRPGEDASMQYDCPLSSLFSLPLAAADDDSSSSMLCLHRFKIWWMKPHWVVASSLSLVPPETILLLYKYDDHGRQMYHLLLAVAMPVPTAASTTRSDSSITATTAWTFASSSLCGNSYSSSNSSVHSTATDVNEVYLCSNQRATALYRGRHADPYTLIQEAVTLAARLWQPTATTTARSNNHTPSNAVVTSAVHNNRAIDTGRLMHTTLGWCTWNALYTNVTGQSVVDAVRRLQVDYNVPMRWMILDDGWQDTVASTSTLTLTPTPIPAAAAAVVPNLLSPESTHTTTNTDGCEKPLNAPCSKNDTQHLDDNNDSDNDTVRIADGEQWSRRLKTLREDPVKFPAPAWTLKATIEQLRRRRRHRTHNSDSNGRDSDSDRGWGLDAILVWHTLAGYWLGIDVPNGRDTATTTTTTTPTLLAAAESNQHPEPVQAQSRLPPGKLYYPHFSRGILHHDPTASSEASVTRGIGIPDSAQQFYQQYHTDYLGQYCGVDGVKVDAQAVTGILSTARSSTTATIANQHQEDVATLKSTPPSLALHAALADSVLDNFVIPLIQQDDGIDEERARYTDTSTIAPVIHCMAHSPEIFYRLPALYNSMILNADTSYTDESTRTARPFFRSADDYYPDNPASHGAQIAACACNSLLFGHLAIPDWDMFTTTLSDESYVRMHAIAKCVSGGPIYLSDKPPTLDSGGDESTPPPNRTALEWLCCEDGTTFPCRAAALPMVSSLFTDPLASASSRSCMSPFVVWNTNGDAATVTSAILGLFCLRGSGRWDPAKLDYSNEYNGSGTLVDTTPTVDYRLEFRPSDIPLFTGPDFRHVHFLLVGFFTDLVQIVDQEEALTLQLSALQSDSIVVYPVRSISNRVDFVALGMRGQINGAGAVVRLGHMATAEAENNKPLPLSTDKVQTNATIRMAIHGCGTLDMAIRLSPAAVSSDRSFEVRVRLNGILVPHSSVTVTEAGESHPLSPNKRDALLALGFDVISVQLPPLDSTLWQQHHDVVVDLSW